jgi:hypothetical protein
LTNRNFVPLKLPDGLSKTHSIKVDQKDLKKIYI